MLNTMKLSGAVNPELLGKVRVLECRLALLVNVIAATLAGLKFTSNQIEREEEALDAELLDKSPFELSGGQKRRVAIAGAGRGVVQARVRAESQPALPSQRSEVKWMA